MTRMVDAVLRFFASWRFAAFALALLAGYELALLALLLLPDGDGALAAFAAEFRTWCFASDPATGRLQPGYVVTMLTSPLLLGGVVGAFWGAPLAAAWRARPRAFAPWGAGALACVVAALALAAGLGGRDPQGELPFPAEGLRTQIPVHDFTLTDHDGRPFDLAATRGRVVLLTAVYATCGSTCPRIMDGAKDAVAALTPDERRDLLVVGVTLDPARDDPATLAAMVAGRELDPHVFRFVTGEPAAVERVLDAFSVARQRDPETGVIEHANLFLLIDRDHRLAYRLTLGERQQRWLLAALRLLLAEPRARP
jgi:protein SCO1/2